jgi:hypothetical protein
LADPVAPVGDGAPSPLLETPDPQELLRALLATGMRPWDAKMALLEAGADPAAFPELQAVPTVVRRAFSGEPEALLAFVDLAETDHVGANAALDAYYEGEPRPSIGQLRAMQALVPKVVPNLRFRFRSGP